MGKHRAPEGDELTSFAAGGRPGREHPDGWNNGRDRTEDDTKPSIPTQRVPVYGYGPDGVEGWH